MVAELYYNYGFLSMLLSIAIAGYFSLWLMASYPAVSGFATLAGIGMVIYNWSVGEPTGWLDFPFLIMINHMIFSLFFTKEGWKLIFVVITVGFILNLSGRLRKD